jgi:acetyl esterase
MTSMTTPSEVQTVEGSVYSAEMQAELDRLERLITKTVDLTQPWDAAARKLDTDNCNRVWNIDMPDVAEVRHFTIPADPSIDAADCEAVVYRPDQAGEGLIFYVHGGGWTFMDLTTHERLMRVLCNEARTTVIGVHYRLAPENPFPAGLKDVVSAFRRVLSSRTQLGLPEGPVIIAGDSAGGNLALATMLHEIDAGRELPAGALLVYGVFGADFETPSYKAYAEGHGLTKAIMRQLWDWYVPVEAERRNPLAAPIEASDTQLRALPPLFMVVAEVDPLASDTFILKQRLDQLGRTDTVWLERGVVHSFILMTAVLEAARRATREAAKAARRFIAAAKRD